MVLKDLKFEFENYLNIFFIVKRNTSLCFNEFFKTKIGIEDYKSKNLYEKKLIKVEINLSYNL